MCHDIKALVEDELSYKARLVKWGQKERKKISFIIKSMEMVNKRKLYEVAIVIDEEEVMITRNHSKKIAEEQASERLCNQMSI